MYNNNNIPCKYCKALEQKGCDFGLCLKCCDIYNDENLDSCKFHNSIRMKVIETKKTKNEEIKSNITQTESQSKIKNKEKKEVKKEYQEIEKEILIKKYNYMNEIKNKENELEILNSEIEVIECENDVFRNKKKLLKIEFKEDIDKLEILNNTYKSNLIEKKRILKEKDNEIDNNMELDVDVEENADDENEKSDEEVDDNERIQLLLDIYRNIKNTAKENLELKYELLKFSTNK
jgi:hypothetical protein